MANLLQQYLDEIERQKDTYLLPENLKKDVSLLGVTGTLESGTTINNQDLEITENGTYTAEEGYTGLGTVNVNVEGGSTGWDTSQLTSMYHMFYNNPSTSLDFTNFDTSNVTTMGSMFYDCNALTSLDLSNFDTSNVTDMVNMFNNCTALTSLDLSNFDLSKVTNFGQMFQNCYALATLVFPGLTNNDTNNNLASVFCNCETLTSIDLTSDIITSEDYINIFYMDIMFWKCYSLTTITIPKVILGLGSLYGIFNECRELTSINISDWTLLNESTDNGNLIQTFNNCYSLTSDIDLSWYVCNNDIELEQTFYNCTLIPSINLSGISNVLSANNTFNGCTNLKTLDISGCNWTFTDANIFTGCTSLETVYVKDEDSKTACDTALAAAGLSIESTIKE